MSEPRYGYMCKVDFDWELGEALGGTTIYPSIDDLKSKRPCVFTCGIVKVKIELEEVVEPGKKWGEDDKAESK